MFSPNNALPEHWLYWLGTAQIGVGLCLLYGGMTRLGAVVLGVAWLLGVGIVGLEPMLENLHILGFAVFFALTGRGPYAIDRLLFPVLEPSPHLARRAMVSLRVATGGALAVVAFTEKLANPALARAFLQAHPLNFTPWLGVPMSDDLFILCAGTTELIIGLCLILGLFPRVVILTSWLFDQHDAHDLQLGQAGGAPAALRGDGHSAGMDPTGGGPALVGAGRAWWRAARSS